MDNEFRNELPKYKEKPKIAPVDKPSVLTGRVSAFLEKATKQDGVMSSATNPSGDQDRRSCDKMVEMDVYITPSGDSDGE